MKTTLIILLAVAVLFLAYKLHEFEKQVIVGLKDGDVKGAFKFEDDMQYPL